jgi:uncharacterized membrane protein YqjE
MSEKAPDSSVGLFESLKILAATLVAVGHTRLELLSTELEEERERLGAMLISTLLALFCFGLGAVLMALLLVAVFWETHRLLVVGLLAALFLTAGAAAWAFAKNKARIKPRLFHASLSELAKDREHLRPRE